MIIFAKCKKASSMVQLRKDFIPGSGTLPLVWFYGTANQ